MPIRKGLAACAVLLTITTPADADPAPMDLLMVHGHVLSPQGDVQAVAIRNGTIIAVGSDEAIMALPHDGAVVVDLAGRTAMPGLYDMHVHVFAAGQDKLSCRLPQGAGARIVAETVQRCAQKARPGEWILGGGWSDSDFRPGEQTRAVLDAAAPRNPVVLNDEALHSLWVNSAALAAAGVTRSTTDPQGGRIERDRRGEPTGVLRESATRLVEDRIPVPDVATQIAAIRSATDDMLAQGIVGFTDASVRQVNVAGLSGYARSGGLKQHARGCIVWGPNSGGSESLVAQRQDWSAGRMQFDCVKLFLDGVPTGSRTGAMLEPYVPRAGARGAHAIEHGMLMIPQDQLDALVIEFDRQGLEIKFHAAGDRATRAAADAIAAARAVNGNIGPRHEIGHNTFIAPADIPRARELGFAWEFSPYIWYPTPITSVDITTAVGPERMKRLWPIAEALRTGALVVAGSDWPVVPSVNPWLAIETMISRQAPGATGPTMGEGERVTRQQALDIFTRNGAALMGRLDRGGTIEPGKDADIIIVDRNPLTTPLGGIHQTRVSRTYIRGELVHADENTM